MIRPQRAAWAGLFANGRKVWRPETESLHRIAPFGLENSAILRRALQRISMQSP